MPNTAISLKRASVVTALLDALGALVITTPEARMAKGHDRSRHAWEPPLAVVQPRTTADVATALRICHDHRIAVVPRGSGTGLEGGSNTSSDSICLDLSEMDAILKVSPDDMYAKVQAGVMKSALNDELAQHELAFPVGPGIDASIGGMASTSASGTTAVNYGTLKENVSGLTVVLADGSIVSMGGVTKKTSAGYDLTHLMVGSEGTLGVITEVTVRVHPVPETTAVSVWSLRSLSTAVDLVVTALRSSLRLARVELLDQITVEAIGRYNGFQLPVMDTLIVEFEGTAEEVKVQSTQFRKLAERFHASLAASASDREGAARIWQARHDALPASLALIPGSQPLATDVCVPLSQLAQCILSTKDDVDASGVLAPIVGHVGDGNFHLAFVLPPDDAEAYETAQRINDRLVDRALQLGGTCSGEHGIGSGKISSLGKEHPSAVSTMTLIKQALDPRGILNPGKVIPDLEFAETTG